MGENIELVIITGMSGAGKTVAMQSFEDMGYYCVDNMPPNLLPTFWDLVRESGHFSKIALVMDLRMRDFFEQMKETILKVENSPHITTRILYLEATEKELVSRYKETRRSHPLATNGRTIDGIRKEKELLEDIKTRAQVVLDTTNLTPRQLREKLIESFKAKEKEMFRVEMVSFGFKYGLPIDADIVMDVRFLPNPHYIEELRPQTGLDKKVYDYVMQQPETEPFYKKFAELLDYSLPGYKREGKSNITIAIGCTGGKHRSVAIAERLGHKIEADGYLVNITHRDKDKTKESTVRS
ncbi:RNase adapter RapZ [Marinilactibacillus psychrotolerans]|uniref:RNase adapter RapZ n=2 Tax=Marinilactibacillus psychrotolerans TaxID=191770 RepID=A0ABW8UHD1_9LACT|nr:RNase adapter RapZ [Marinilactibacillus psychrotolerans]GEQ32842.1 ATPase P [Marinilactibacillus psychrotolerans]SJN26694.1 Hypothetical ATP-binding protein UPF0042, contains P-loop [Marinilactibacillus psychrotolerans 42ea]